jgi:GMP synthase (glutamine-hydrolysing)
VSAAASTAGSKAVLVIQPDPSDPPGRVGDWLTATGLELDVRDLDQGHPVPTELSGYAGLVVLGGAASATDPAQAGSLAPVRALLRAAVTHEVPTLAICLGAQLLAVAHGGQVERGDGEFGAQLVAKRAAASSDPLLREVPITPDVVQWHFDAVTRLPAGAVVLATSPSCEVQAFRLGRLAWGLQFHIETTPDVVQVWAVEDAEQLGHLDLDRTLKRVRETDADVAEAWQPVVETFAAIVRDPSAVAAARAVAAVSAAPITDPAAIRAALAAEMAAARTPLPTPVHRHDVPQPREESADPPRDER